MGDRYLKTFLEFLKLAPRYLVALGAISAFLIFGPQNWLQSLGLYDFAQDYRQWIAILLIFTSVLLVVDRPKAVFHWIRNKMLIRKFAKRQLERLDSLTENEKQILRFYIRDATRTNYLSVHDGVVQGLVSSGIIYRSAGLGQLDKVGGVVFAYNISDLAWDYLNINKHLLDGDTDIVRTDKSARDPW